MTYRRPREGAEGSFVTIIPPTIDGETATISTVVSFGPHAGSVGLCRMKRTPTGWVRTGCQRDETIEF